MVDETPTKQPITAFPNSGFVRLKDIIGPSGPIPISRSSWFARIQAGEFPRSVRLGPRTTAWRIEDIRALIEKLSQSNMD
jgi:prophage regulatory protein